MKRGFLRKGFDKGIQEPRKKQELQPKDVTLNVNDIIKGIPTDLLNHRLPYGNLSDQEKTLPEDYDTNTPSGFPSLFRTIPHIPDGDGSAEWVIKDKEALERVMNTPGYPARTPKPRRPDLYEVRATPGMGLGTFAKHNISRGEPIFSERPLLVAPNWLAMIDPNDRYTPSQTRQIMMYEHEKVLEVAVQRMNENDKGNYMALYNSHTNDGSGPLFGIMRTNGFAEELSDDSPLHYSAVFNVGSRLNHSCKPNVQLTNIKLSSFSLQCVANRDIKAGEELFCSYCSRSGTKAERQAELAPYGFSCTCSACINATPATDNLRKRFGDEVLRLDGRTKQPELRVDAVASAKVLEAEMIAEGLDSTYAFFILLCAIHVSSAKLGRTAERMKYERRVKDYCKIHLHDKPQLQRHM